MSVSTATPQSQHSAHIGSSQPTRGGADGDAASALHGSDPSSHTVAPISIMAGNDALTTLSQLAHDEDFALRRACCEYSVRSTKPGLAPARHGADIDGEHSQAATPLHRPDPCVDDDDACDQLPFVFQFTEAVAQRRRPWGAPAGNSDY